MKATLNEAIEDYLRWRRSQGLKPTTLRSHTSILRRFLTVTGNIYCDKITELTMTRYFEEASKTKQAQSLNNDQTCLAVFFDWCRHSKRMPTDCDPLYGRRRPKPIRRERNRVGAGEFSLLLDAAGRRTPRDRAAMAVLLYTLLRDREVADLRVGDVDLDNGWLRARITKSGIEDRMPISEELDGELRVWLTHYTEQVGPLKPHYYLVPARKIQPGRREDGRFIPVGADSLRPETRVGLLSRIVNPVLESIGFPTTDTDGRPLSEGAHTIRRSGARALFDTLVALPAEERTADPIRIVQSLLHHSSVTTTERYIGATPDRRSRDDILRGKKMFGRSVENVRYLKASGGEATANPLPG